MASEAAPAIVLDSSFLIAWHNTRDVHHAEVARVIPDGSALVRPA